MDKTELLGSLTDDELLGELAKRANDAQRRADRLNAATGTGPKFKSTAKSLSKQKYWAAYRASGLTLKEFQQKTKGDKR